MTVLPVVRVRPGVKFDIIAPAGFRILAAIDSGSKYLGGDLWITSGTDSHAAGRHLTGEAYDVSIKDLPTTVMLKLKRYLEQNLGERFTVLYEVPTLPDDPVLASIAFVNPDATAPHLHIQPRKNTVYPPSENVPYYL